MVIFFIYIFLYLFLIHLYCRILTGCYDYSVNIWTLHGKPVVSLKEHKNVVKAVSWLDEKDPSKGFVSVSHDLTGILWFWEPGTY